MKNLNKIFFLLLLISALPVFGQNWYDTQWKILQQNEEKGQYKSNLPLVIEIQNRAMKDQNTAELLRSLQYEFQILNNTEDDAQNDGISRFFKKISDLEPKVAGDGKMLYKALTGKFVLDYYEENSWEIRGRTNVVSPELAGIETWSRLDFKNYLSAHFATLEKETARLRQVKMASYKELFEQMDDLEFFPTLFEWNALQQISFLRNADFFTKNELAANHPKIQKIYENLIAQNSGNARLFYAHQKLEYEVEYLNSKDKKERLIALLNSDFAGDYKVEITKDLAAELLGENKQTEALKWIRQAEATYPKSRFLPNILNLKNGIVNPVLSLKFEDHTQPGKPIHLVAEYKNISAFSLNIYEVKEDVEGFLKFVSNRYQKEYFAAVSKKLVRKDQFTVKNTGDYKLHKTSLEMKALPAGLYLAEYVVEGGIAERFYFISTASRIISEQKNQDRKSEVLKLVSRENGRSEGNQPITFYELTNGAKTVKSSGTADKNGNFTIPATENSRYYRTVLVRQTASDSYNLLQVYGDNYSYQSPDQNNLKKAQIFLDRAIYRPGQTVYFKVINTQLSGEKEMVAAGLRQNIFLRDANHEVIGSQTFTTNTFGSYHGSFVLPQGKLNGYFTLTTDNGEGYRNFQVEEYKRPKFEVTFEPVEGEYKYGQTLELKGKAMMFSGVPLSNATVNYEIKKRNIRWMYFWWFPRGNDNENSILGQVKTNEKGEFTIKVDLKKDETLDGIQIDNYEINASVTDINGETQSANTQVKVSSVTHFIEADELVDQFSDENIEVKVRTKNYNGQDLKKSYQVKLSKLEEPQRVIRSNFTSAVQDLPSVSKSEFVSKFPHDYYEAKELPENWKEIQTVLAKTETAGGLNLGKLAPGSYKLELYNIEGRDTIKTEQRFSVFNRKFLVNTQKPYLNIVPEKTEYKPGETARIYVYSAVPNAPLYVFRQYGDGKTLSETYEFKDGVVVYSAVIPKDEKLENVNLQFQLVAFNDVQTQSVTLKIASDKKPLRIETVTFRDKLQPGALEKWRIKVLGDDREKITAEVLANMYDMSLDQFAKNSYDWSKLFQHSYIINSYGIGQNLESVNYSKRSRYDREYYIDTPEFEWFGYRSRVTAELQSRVMKSAAVSAAPPPPAMREEAADAAFAVDSAMVANEEAKSAKSVGKKEAADLSKIPVRQNLNETAFFYPDLLTDAEGNINFEFTSPEALTQWKLMLLAHTKDARSAVLEKEVVTQKDFSVTPNYPRFLREGDELVLQTKLNSLVAKKLTGTATLQILDAFTNEDITSKFGISSSAQKFSLAENGSNVTGWRLKVPAGISSAIIKTVAKAGNYSDGEQQAVAVLPNRILVTETVPVFVKEGQTKTFELKGLKNVNSSTLTNFSNTLELSTNPIWEVIFALPSLKEDENQSADVVFNRWFADVIAAEIFRTNPGLKTIFEEYSQKDLLKSNLDKNQELKQLLLEETPWVLDAKSEEEQMAKISRLFDLNNMKNSIQNDWEELRKLQNPDGGFSWYSGYPSSYQTSLYILKNLGRLNEWLGAAVNQYQSAAQRDIVSKLVKYTDNEVNRFYTPKNKEIITNWTLDYLDSRHYWEKQYPLGGNGAKIKTAVISKARTAPLTDFTFFGLHRAALLFDFYGLKDVSDKLLTYLKETSTDTDTQGVYWKSNLDGWGWYSSKTVNHAGALEAFNKLRPTDQNFIEELKIWLVTQKEVNSWGSSRGTAEVIYTLLNSGKSWTGTASDESQIVWGGKAVENPAVKATGYLKTALRSAEIDPGLATLKVSKPGPGIVQGGLFWQYYEDLNKIKSSESYISITKELYRKVKTENGEELRKITAGTPLKVGDKVTVRMILNTDRPMEFIHMKDMRAAGFEPLDVISGYEWKNGLGYYRITKDASTNFYIEYMPKGKYVFEYDYVANAAGKFSNGITTLQNYYAPQLNAHTKGMTVEITNQ